MNVCPLSEHHCIDIVIFSQQDFLPLLCVCLSLPRNCGANYKFPINAKDLPGYVKGTTVAKVTPPRTHSPTLCLYIQESRSCSTWSWTWTLVLLEGITTDAGLVLLPHELISFNLV